MKISYKVEGLRSLKSMPFIEFRPVTILVGLNNSGKSTFLRSLPLLKQSIESESTAAITWSDGLVDFGNFETALNHGLKNKNEEITFAFKISELELFQSLEELWNIPEHQFVFNLLCGLFPNLRDENYLLYGITYSMSVRVDHDAAGNKLTVPNRINICISSLKLNIELLISKDGKHIENMKIDDEKIAILLNLEKYNETTIRNESILLLDLAFGTSELRFGEIYTLQNSLSVVIDELTEFLKTGDLNLSYTRPLCSAVLEMFRYSDKYGFNPKRPKIQFKRILEESEPWVRNRLKEYAGLFLLWLVSNKLQYLLKSVISEISYLKPLRVGNPRTSAFQEGVSTLDSTGENLSQFLIGLDENQKSEFSDWIRKLYGFGLKTEIRNQRVSLGVDFDGQTLNVVDTGVGISQLLPALAKVWWAKHKPKLNVFTQRNSLETSWDRFEIIALEQPELHLHPEQQANLVDAFIDIATGCKVNKAENPKILLETHSEKLVSRFSRRIQEGKIDHNDVQVVWFGSTKTKKPFVSTVELCPFNEDGTLENWQYGFFNSG